MIHSIIFLNIYVLHENVPEQLYVYPQKPEGSIKIPLQLELQMIAGHLMWVLRVDPRFSSRAARAPND